MKFFPPSLWAFLLCLILAPSTSSAAQPKSQRITFAALTPKMVGDSVFEVQASASSGLAIELTSSNPSVAEIVTVAGSAKSLRILKSGSTVITAKQAGNATFAAAKDVKRPLNVKARPEGFSHAITLTASDILTPSGAYDYEAGYSMLAFRAVKRDALFFGAAPAANFEPQMAEIYVDGVSRGTVDFHKGRLNRPFGYILEEAPWRMLEGKLKSGRVDLYTTLKPFRSWKEVLLASTYNPEAQNSENPSLPLFEESGANTLASVFTHAKGDLFYFSKVATNPPMTVSTTEIRVKGVLRAFIQWPPELEGSDFGFRRARTGAHTKGPEKIAVLQDGQVLNFDF